MIQNVANEIKLAVIIMISLTMAMAKPRNLKLRTPDTLHVPSVIKGTDKFCIKWCKHFWQ